MSEVETRKLEEWFLAVLRDSELNRLMHIANRSNTAMAKLNLETASRECVRRAEYRAMSDAKPVIPANL